VESVHFVITVSIVGGLLAAGAEPAHGQVGHGSPELHPAAAAQVVTVTVKELRRFKHGKDQEFLIAQAVGFPNDTCDVVTTFDVVKKYEERQTWTNVKQRIDIVLNGKAHPAKFRDLGFYPLGLNLACIDFESPVDRAAAQISALPLDENPPDISSLSYDNKEIARSHPGTPFLNKRGEISSVLIASPDGPVTFASAADVRLFLKVAARVSPWPILRRRPMSAI
jgi:hypothetical protein